MFAEHNAARHFRHHYPAVYRTGFEHLHPSHLPVPWTDAENLTALQEFPFADDLLSPFNTTLHIVAHALRHKSLLSRRERKAHHALVVNWQRVHSEVLESSKDGELWAIFPFHETLFEPFNSCVHPAQHALRRTRQPGWPFWCFDEGLFEPFNTSLIPRVHHALRQNRSHRRQWTKRYERRKDMFLCFDDDLFEPFNTSLFPAQHALRAPHATKRTSKSAMFVEPRWKTVWPFACFHESLFEPMNTSIHPAIHAFRHNKDSRAVEFFRFWPFGRFGDVLFEPFNTSLQPAQHALRKTKQVHAEPAAESIQMVFGCFDDELFEPFNTSLKRPDHAFKGVHQSERWNTMPEVYHQDLIDDDPTAVQLRSKAEQSHAHQHDSSMTLVG
eukprot:GILK01011997.1.p1 GENE.GILK01011997.1~~GILK01011997.1.p1  ORF type:complete len:385 (+),score=46.45 GILK01011997.1:110-1264(+)